MMGTEESPMKTLNACGVHDLTVLAHRLTLCLLDDWIDQRRVLRMLVRLDERMAELVEAMMATKH